MAVDRTRGGVVAILGGIAVAAVVGFLDWRWTGQVHLRLLAAAFTGGGFAALRLAEKTGLIDEGYQSPSVLDTDTPAHHDIENVPIVPGGPPIRLPGPR